MSENKEKNANEKSITSFFENIFSKIKGWFKSAIRYIALSAILFVTVIIGKKTVTKIKENDDKKENEIKENIETNNENVLNIEDKIKSAEEKISEIKQDIEKESENTLSEVNSFNEKQKEKLENFGFKKEVKDE
jgi:SMC interacting uncharacterized protein involved in chromosome segregation